MSKCSFWLVCADVPWIFRGSCRGRGSQVNGSPSQLPQRWASSRWQGCGRCNEIVAPVHYVCKGTGNRAGACGPCCAARHRWRGCSRLSSWLSGGNWPAACWRSACPRSGSPSLDPGGDWGLAVGANKGQRREQRPPEGRKSCAAACSIAAGYGTALQAMCVCGGAHWWHSRRCLQTAGGSCRTPTRRSRSRVGAVVRLPARIPHILPAPCHWVAGPRSACGGKEEQRGPTKLPRHPMPLHHSPTLRYASALGMPPPHNGPWRWRWGIIQRRRPLHLATEE